MNIAHFFGPGRRYRRELDARRQRLYRIAYAWCHDPHIADDLVQQTFAKAIEKRQQLRAAQALDTWLLRILANCWRDHCRQQRKTVDINVIALIADTDPSEDHSRLEIVRRVRAAVACLNPDQRQVVTLVDLEGLTYAEVADVLGIPIGPVTSRLLRARAQLQRYLLDMAPETYEKVTRLRRVK